jgi:hypothetical protein
MFDALAHFNGNGPATCEGVEACEKQLNCQLPGDYVAFLKGQNGGEGFIGNDAYLILWAVDELELFSREYEVGSYCPELLLIGSNGGGEAFAFDKRYAPWGVVQVPFVGMDYSLCVVIGCSFSEFIKNSIQEGYECVNESVRRARVNELAGKELFEIQPILLGGHPTDPSNKTVVNRQQHIQAVTYWNREIRRLRMER